MGQLYGHDGHGMWPLVVLHGYDSDGSPRHGGIYKWIAEGSDKADWQPTGPELVRLDVLETATVEDITYNADGTPGKYREKARGTVVWAEVPADADLGEWATRMNDARNRIAKLYEEAGMPVPHYVPGPIIKPAEEAPAEEFDPRDTDRSGDVSKKEQRKWDRKHPDGGAI